MDMDMNIVQMMESLRMEMPAWAPDLLRTFQAAMERDGKDWRALIREEAANVAALQTQHASWDANHLQPPASNPGLEPQALKEWMAQYKAFYEQEEKTSPLPAPMTMPSVALERVRAARSQLEIRIKWANVSKTIPVKYSSRHSSLTPFRQLKPVTLGDTFTHKVHTGRYLLCRTIASPGSRVPVVLAIEDPDNCVVTVTIYHFPTISNCSLEHLDAVFPVGTLLAIREPAYDPASPFPRLAVRVDSPTDIVFLSPNDVALRGIVWSSGAQVSGAPVLPSTADGWKARGDALFKNGEWLPAAIAYSHGLAVDPAAVVVRLNRAEAFLRLEYFSGAFADAEHVYKASDVADAYRQKALYRLARAAYGREQYEVSEKFFQEWQKLNPQHSEVSEWIMRAQKRVAETRTGRYDWVSLAKCAKNRDSLDIGDYQGPIAVQPLGHRGGGRGIVATDDVDVGTLLLVAKPFVAVNGCDLEGKEENMFADIAKGKLWTANLSELLVRMVQKLHGNPDLHNAVLGLYAGPPYPPPSTVYPPPAEATTVNPLMPTIDIDIMKLEHICILNSFEPDSIYPLAGNDNAHEASKNAIFLLASFFNHSCAPNATHFFLGETIVVRAAQKIKAGEEIMIRYISYASYLARTKDIEFQLASGCQCWLCEMDKKDGRLALRKRQEAYNKMQTTPIGSMSFAAAQSLERTLEGTYTSSRTAPRIELGLMQLQTTCKLFRDKNASREAIKYATKALRNIGFTVLDRKSEPLPIATNNVPTVVDYRQPTTAMMQLCKCYLVLKDKASATKWLRAMRWYISMVIAEGSDVFLFFAGPVLEQDPDLFAFAMQTE